MPQKPFITRVSERIKAAAVAVSANVEPVAKKKPISFVGAARSDLQALPEDFKDLAGQELRKLQFGEDPDVPIKPMPAVGAGAQELIVDTKDGWFRVFYVVKFEEAMYVLHSFQKKTNKTAKADIDMGARRYQTMMQSRNKK